MSMLWLLMATTSGFLLAQDQTKILPNHEFTVINQVKSLPVLSQGGTGTCWSYGTTSMLESEIIRFGGPETDLSEMFTARNIYAEKAANYVRFHGTVNFDQGGEQHDVITSFVKYGMVPQDIYPGLNYGENTHQHGEIASVLKGVVENVIKNRNGKLSPVWMKGVNGILDAYFGVIPNTFSYRGNDFTPQSYAASLGIHPGDYVMLSSFNHHPFYSPFVIEIPDNWAQKTCINLPLDELMEVIDHALNQGISISWGADISGLNFEEGVATLPVDGADLKDPQHQEKTVNQEDRQYMFDSYQLTDDHCMHLVGVANNQFGKKFYIEKNSWGEGGKYKGFSYMSEAFMRMRTVSIMVHKDGIPAHIAAKTGIKK